MQETWKGIIGYEGIYQVSDCGRVRSVSRITPHGRMRKGQIIKLRTGSGGTPKVALYRNAIPQTFSVHCLVLTAFAGPRPAGMVTRHLDGNPANNHAGNIMWGTQSDNMKDKARHGTTARGEKHSQSRMTEADVLLIRGCRGSQKEIAETFGLCGSHVSRIISRELWSHI